MNVRMEGKLKSILIGQSPSSAYFSSIKVLFHSVLVFIQVSHTAKGVTVFDDYSIPPKRVGENNAPRTCVRSVAGAY